MSRPLERKSGAVANQREKFRGLRMASVHKRLHEEHAMAPNRFDHRHNLAMVGGRRLFAQDMFTALGTPYRPFAVKVVGKRDVDSIDRAAVEKLVQFSITQQMLHAIAFTQGVELARSVRDERG